MQVLEKKTQLKREELLSPSRRKNYMWSVTINPTPCLPAPLGGGGKTGKKEDVRGRCFKVCLYLSLSCSDFLAINLINTCNESLFCE